MSPGEQKKTKTFAEEGEWVCNVTKCCEQGVGMGSTPFKEYSNVPKRFMFRKLEISTGSNEPLTRLAQAVSITTPAWLANAQCATSRVNDGNRRHTG